MTTQTPTYDNYIGGRWVGSDGRSANTNPSDTTDVVGLYAQGGAQDVSAAVDAAREALPDWSGGGVQRRFEVLDRVGTRIAERAEELATLLAREEGKPVAEARGEVVRAAQLFKFFAGESVRNTGEVVESSRPGLTVEMTREPVGVVGVITPWNFPIAIPAWKIAPALAYGNTVVVKPAEVAPGCAWEIVSMLHDAGLPPGVVNLVMGPGRVVGEALSSSGGVDALTFTGSAAVGSRVARAAVASGTRVQCEMGGKNPLVVLGDADLDVAVEAAVNGAYFSTGQRCTASSRLIVTDDVHDEFVERLRARMATLTVGHALDPATVIGPVVDDRQLTQDLRYIETAGSEGGEVHGGSVVERPTPGYFLEPALVVGTTPDMTINREEVFGPVASVQRVGDYDEALAAANDTAYGLSAGVCSQSLSKVAHFKRHVQAGMVMVNAPTAGVDYHVSFGGRKGSSYGHREQGRAAREFFTVHKTAYVNAG
jgi:alpha-ketoglutaric semialdehyde dehydrogenase